MKTIIMDTSNKYLVIALYEDDHCIDSLQEYGNQRQSEYALVNLKKMLDDHQMKFLDFDEMVITIGPGSYTGQRVALTIAKTICAVSPMKLKTVSSLKAYAGNEKAISIIDARSQKCFIGVYDQGQTILEDTIIPIDEFDTYRQEYPDYQVVGDCQCVGLENHEVDLVSHIYKISRNEKYVEDIDQLVPQYIKDVEAKTLK